MSNNQLAKWPTQTEARPRRKEREEVVMEGKIRQALQALARCKCEERERISAASPAA